MKKMTLFLLLVSIYGCLKAQAPADTFAYKEILDIPYLESEVVQVDSLQRLHLVLPEGVEQPPLLLWIGGGAWSFVDRNVEMNLARKFAREGIAVASVGHRLSRGLFKDSTRTHGVKHPVHIKDIAAAFKWLYDHAEEYGYSQDNLFVGGFSSGGHLSALLAMDDRYLEAHGLSVKDIRAVIPISGAYDINNYYSVFLNHEDPQTRTFADTHVKDVFGDTEADFTDASPTTYMDNLSIPMLLISDHDLYNYTKVFEEKLRESGYRDCQILHVFNFGHGGLWRDMSNSPDSQTRRIMIDFIRRNTSY
ncbi:MAG: alpha/beta hydrolase [Lewinellaceae bacterium]|nr:alpha/beta hydrolase [Lewinellaceae bacterium]